MKVKIAPSILSADFSRLAEQIKEVENEGAGLLHIDVMDGHFVPNITIGPVVVKRIRHVTKLPFDVHLMITHPKKYIKDFAEVGADLITFHIESEDGKTNPESVINEIRSHGKKVGITLNPPTPFSTIEPYMGMVDMVLVMTVNPGFSGQGFIAEAAEKIALAKKLADAQGYNIDIEVDGGINPSNAPIVVKKGANILVAGNAVFKGEIISNMRALIGSVENL
jgi:ribulose-phosphate 3-epimerase